MFSSYTRKKRSSDAFHIVHHSGVFGPVHTGIDYILEASCALRPWRRRVSDSHTPASVPFRCVPPPRGTTAQPSSGHALPRGLPARFLTVLQAVGRQPTLRLALLPEVRCTRFVFPYMFSGRGLGLPPRRYCFSSLRSHSMSSTLHRLLCLPGLPGGFQVAATGDEKSSTCEVLHILMAVRKLISDIHVGRVCALGFFFKG